MHGLNSGTAAIKDVASPTTNIQCAPLRPKETCLGSGQVLSPTHPLNLQETEKMSQWSDLLKSGHCRDKHAGRQREDPRDHTWGATGNRDSSGGTWCHQACLRLHGAPHSHR